MQIIEYFEDFNNKKNEQMIEKIENCDWAAAKFLAKLLREEKFEETLGGDGKLYIMLDGEKIVSFVTLTVQDCIADKSLFPWLGFLFTSPEYRGHRYSEQIIEHAVMAAKEAGNDTVYLATDHEGLYEKYGFTYVENRTDVWGDDSRIYYRRFL